MMRGGGGNNPADLVIKEDQGSSMVTQMAGVRLSLSLVLPVICTTTTKIFQCQGLITFSFVIFPAECTIELVEVKTNGCIRFI